jgi:hypothetical protein
MGLGTGGWCGLCEVARFFGFWAFQNFMGPTQIEIFVLGGVIFISRVLSSSCVDHEATRNG